MKIPAWPNSRTRGCPRVFPTIGVYDKTDSEYDIVASNFR